MHNKIILAYLKTLREKYPEKFSAKPFKNQSQEQTAKPAKFV